ncbi:hypothetical protein K505DRAFT_347710 [Melanomma pulvis-pyrius CBS 109.77]|uniref:Rhodopsin domain-containing protein n=1 Tax=Melanomma pulvis-pyrius CBS 109.77 TaxID=1314802 RepID=A0A6A6XKI6_9PLEO|nr:hypothetical protein K505DRAFT_347710 [Melanomma pulvis-pyrius CBS 109.77]
MWRDPGKILIVVGFTLTSVSTLMVALRLYSRHFRMHMAGASDYIMLLALTCTWATTVLNYYQTKFGKDARLSQVEKNPNSPKVLAAVSGTLITWYIYRPLYIITLSLVKLSILAFYRTFVPPHTSFRSFRSFRHTINILMIFIVLYTVSVVGASIFQCTPISAAYSVTASYSQLSSINGDQQPERPHCYQPAIFWIFTATINFATDMLILALPIPILLSLQNLPPMRRIALLAIFSVGILAIAASAVRMWILMLWYRDVRTQNKYGTELLTWGQVEVNSGILGASAPFLRVVWRRLVSKWKGKVPVMRGKVQVRRAERGEVEEREVNIAAPEKVMEAGIDIVERR